MKHIKAQLKFVGEVEEIENLRRGRHLCAACGETFDEKSETVAQAATRAVDSGHDVARIAAKLSRTMSV